MPAPANTTRPRARNWSTSTTSADVAATSVSCCEPPRIESASVAARTTRRGAAALAPRGVLSRGDAGREPGGARQQPERLRAGDQVPAGAERHAGVHRTKTPGAAEARERIGRQRRQEVMERDEGEHAARGREQAVRHERRRVHGSRLRIGRERVPRERERVPERDVAVTQALVQERRERRVEGIGVVRVRQVVPQASAASARARGHEHADGDRGDLAGARPGRKAETRERYLYGRAPTCEFGRGAHAPARVDDPRAKQALTE